MSKVDIKFIEIGVSFAILVVFIGLFALARELPGCLRIRILYTRVIFLAFTIVISLWGIKLAPKPSLSANIALILRDVFTVDASQL